MIRPPGDRARAGRRWAAVVATLPFVAAAFAVVFVWRPVSFWAAMTATQAALVTAALVLRPDTLRALAPRATDILWGLGSAAALYGVFVVGDAAARALFDFAGSQIDRIYAIRDEGEAAAIGLLLLLVIGPGEEIYWRGLVQRTLAERFGPLRGLAVTTAVYTLVHVATGNAMLLGAAFVCGAFWGALYTWRGRLAACVISHAVWDVVVLVVLPIGR